MEKKYDEIYFWQIPIGGYFYEMVDGKLFTYIKQSNRDGDLPGIGKNICTFDIREFLALEKVLIPQKHSAFVATG